MRIDTDSHGVGWVVVHGDTHAEIAPVLWLDTDPPSICVAARPFRVLDNGSVDSHIERVRRIEIDAAARVIRFW